MSRRSDSLRSEYQNRLLDKIEEYGWSCPNISDPQSETPGFAYSVGFSETLKCSEFIVFGFDEKLRTMMLGEIFRQIQAGKYPRMANVGQISLRDMAVSAVPCIQPMSYRST